MVRKFDRPDDVITPGYLRNLVKNQIKSTYWQFFNDKESNPFPFPIMSKISQKILKGDFPSDIKSYRPCLLL